MIRGEASEVYRLSGDLSQIGFRTVPALRGAMAGVGEAFAHEWADNARETLRPGRGKGGSHAWGYPDSIDSGLSFTVTTVTVEAGPNVHKKHGFLGKVLEFGGEHSPPYLHGLRALDGMQVRAERVIDATVGHLFG